ncbi:hypothetical protein [Nocardioides zeae]|uniref:Lipoprotein n=1 Tax=Nocardioides zeae TaxID=1457234 RepID=A0A6P0HKD5_9ACTN|nr:hypothetical protein [Nocardioides zeae]NEN78707.1 hypothetical protein [Nocardioides zeae]
MFLHRTLPLSALAVGLVLALGACGSADDPAEPGAADSTPPDATGGTPQSPSLSDPSTLSPSDGSGSDDGADEVLAGAIADLAERESVPSGEVVVVSDAAVQWRSGALGCPEPGMTYTQAITPGRQILLEVAGETFAYHAATDGPASYCVNPEEPASE